MPEADILVVWNDGSAAVIGKISTEMDGLGRARIRCGNLGRGLGWEFIKTGIRLLFMRRSKQGGFGDADGAGEVTAGLGEDCRGEEGVGRVEVREMREAVQEAGRGVRHAQEHADGSASEP